MNMLRNPPSSSHLPTPWSREKVWSHLNSVMKKLNTKCELSPRRGLWPAAIAAKVKATVICQGHQGKSLRCHKNAENRSKSKSKRYLFLYQTQSAISKSLTKHARTETSLEKLSVNFQQNSAQEAATLYWWVASRVSVCSPFIPCRIEYLSLCVPEICMRPAATCSVFVRNLNCQLRQLSWPKEEF